MWTPDVPWISFTLRDKETRGTARVGIRGGEGGEGEPHSDEDGGYQYQRTDIASLI
jgi:hypothetical protein